MTFVFVESEEEEEFFECTSEVEAENVGANAQIKAKHLLWNKPAGRLAKHPSLRYRTNGNVSIDILFDFKAIIKGNLFRLLQTGDPLYLPVTQEPVPKTEDQLEEDAQVMMQLGTDKYASEMRARMMSASLLSDMESFKVRIARINI